MDRKTCSKWKHNNKTGSRNIWVTIRMVQQLVKEYREKNIIHKQKRNRRSKTHLTEEHILKIPNPKKQKKV